MGEDLAPPETSTRPRELEQEEGDMGKQGKRYTDASSRYDRDQMYSATEALDLASSLAGAKFERVDAMNAAGANDAVDLDNGLLARDGIVATVKNSNFLTRFPADIFGCVIDHSLFQSNPRLRKPLGRQFQDLHKRLHSTVKP